MPRDPAVPHEQLIEAILQTADVLDEDGNIPDTKHPVWQSICDRLHNVLKPNYVRQFLRENRHGSHTALLRNRGIEKTSSEEIISMSGSSIHEEESDEEQLIRPATTFKVLITLEDWLIMKPIPYVEKRKNRPDVEVQVLPPYKWQAVIIKLLWEQHKIPCPYTFKRGVVSKNLSSKKDFINITAYCTECKAEAHGRIISKPVTNESVVLLWRAPDTRGKKHKKKRPLMRGERQQLAEEMVFSSASMLRRRHAVHLMDQGDVEPPHLRTAAVLRKAKQQHLDKKHNIVKGSDPVTNLTIMKHIIPFVGSIHDIGADKFFVHYFSPTQLLVYRSYNSRNYVQLSIDATGSLVNKIPRLHNLSGHIFLYEGVINTGKEQLPVLQMLSEKQDSNTIMYWLNEWLRAGATIPNEVVVDDSAALRSAVARAFGAASDVRQLISTCFAALTETNSNLPPTFLRLDVSHFLNAASKWKIWDSALKRSLKNLYMRSIGVLILCTTLEELQTMSTHLLILSLSQFEEDDEGNKLPMEKSLQFVRNRIKSSKVDESLPFADDEFDGTTFRTQLNIASDSDTESRECPSSVEEFISNMQKESQRHLVDCTDGRPNPYYHPEFASALCNILRHFVLWSAVMVPLYKSPFLTASSSCVEGDIADLKGNILRGRKGLMRVDKLVSIHLQSIEGKCRLSDTSETTNKEQIGRTRYRDARKKKLILSDTSDEETDSTCEAKTTAQDQSKLLSDTCNGDSDSSFEKKGKKHQKKRKKTGLETSDSSDDPPAKKKNSSKDKKHEQATNEKEKDKEQDIPSDREDIPSDREEHPTQSTSNEESCTTDEDLSPFDLSNVEAWRGQSVKSRTSRKKLAKHLNPFPELDAAIGNQQLKLPKHRLLKNGNVSGFVEYENNKIKVNNTCPFDAIAQLFSSAYIQYSFYRECLEFYQESTFFQTVKSLAVFGATTDTYKLRAKTLIPTISLTRALSVPATRSRRKTVLALVYDCWGNPPQLAKFLLQELPSAAIEVACSEPSCKRSVDAYPIIESDTQVLLQKGISSLKKSVVRALGFEKGTKPSETVTNVKCVGGCKGQTELTYNLFPHLLLDVEVLSSYKRTCTLAEIPKVVRVLGFSFVLVGVVAFMPAHYVSYVQRTNGTWNLFNDLGKDVLIVNDTEKVQPSLVLYVNVPEDTLSL